MCLEDERQGQAHTNHKDAGLGTKGDVAGVIESGHVIGLEGLLAMEELGGDIRAACGCPRS